jgi:transcriptional regulator with XRE-family HTH domain
VLKMAPLRVGKRQIDLARETGLGESTISRIVNAYREPTAEEKRKIARALGGAVEKFWPRPTRGHADADG